MKFNIDLPKEKCASCKYSRASMADAGSHHRSCSKRALLQEVEAHGINNGWYSFPYDFDSAWLNKCSGYRPKNEDISIYTNERLIGTILFSYSILKDLLEDNSYMVQLIGSERISDIIKKISRVLTPKKETGDPKQNMESLDRKELISLADEMLSL